MIDKVHGWLRAVVSVFAATAGVVLAPSTTLAALDASTYDVPTVARVDDRTFATARAVLALFNDAHDESVSPPVDGSGTSTTPSLSLNATNTALGRVGRLSRAAEFGSSVVRALSQELRGTGLHAHHLIEKRFADVCSGSRLTTCCPSR